MGRDGTEPTRHRRHQRLEAAPEISFRRRRLAGTPTLHDVKEVNVSSARGEEAVPMRDGAVGARREVGRDQDAPYRRHFPRAKRRPFAGGHDGHGHRPHVQYAARDRGQPGHPAALMGPHDDEVGFLRLRDLEQVVGQAAHPAIRTERDHPLAGDVANLRGQVSREHPLHLGIGGERRARGAAVAALCFVGVIDVGQGQVTGGGPPQLLRPLDRRVASGGEVQAEDDAQRAHTARPGFERCRIANDEDGRRRRRGHVLGGASQAEQGRWSVSL